MKKFFRILFDTAWGPAAIWLLGVAAAHLLLLAGFLLQDLLGAKFPDIVAILLFWPPVLISTCAAIAAFIRSLRQRRWKRAAAQTAFGIVALFAGIYLAVVCHLALFPLLSEAPSIPAAPPTLFAVEARRRIPVCQTLANWKAFCQGLAKVPPRAANGFANVWQNSPVFAEHWQIPFLSFQRKALT